MPSTTCLNCTAMLEDSAKFCPACGQKSNTHRLSFSHFSHEFFHALTHADKGIFHLLRELAIRPGKVAKEYIEGRRKKYFNPFSFFLILMGLFVFSSTFFSAPVTSKGPDPAILRNIPTEAGRQQYITMYERGAAFSGFMKKHGNLVAMVAIPFISFITWIFFRNGRYNFAELLTANLLFVTFSNLVFTVLINPLKAVFRGGSAEGYLVLGGLLLHVCYYTWCYYQFLPFTNGRKLLKSLLISVLVVALWSLVSMLAMALYLYRSWEFYKFFTRMM
jgi:hypothetical protein